MKVVRKKKLRKLFTKNWPFTVNSIVIYNMAGASVYCEIKGENYALNGFSQDKLKLTHAFESGYVKIDDKLSNDSDICYMDISHMIEIGLGLFSDKEVNHLRKVGRDIKIINSQK